ncbi:CoB--CoM heterodisulfide reductase iron-sulfur subunit B family protein [Varunaivibrio sulfuroxidans]|uniref:Heterodisulfide reductase subunit B n=1 Tax=Varunaivibrio sulfuroxidans TaxID=1773489 RepID=A0A4V6NYG2_9PROT|nr:CoB--CoM heterodisulfide reductase iron-sulfur subunit B family protein [Varunaivibrio sulfuroxidans]TCS60311.1 heterodisulfide reductase subunit B [Varunaivibrio sulfuroxidans]WES31002.1 CoB--CoM heterodisulfide reductase iron-sulfur subunit B family protein [Varunaivibrio sulfuroxidans]
MSKKYTYYPGCSSEASAKHLDTSLRAIAPKLGVELEDIADWNCCGASVGEMAAGHLANAALSARNLAQAREQGEQDVMTPCAACYLNTHSANEEIRENPKLKDDLNEALAAAGKSYDGDLLVRHACEVLVNDVGLDTIKEQVTNPLKGLKVAGYVGCQTVRPFAGTDRGGKYDTYDDPEFLDNFIESTGAEAVEFENKTSCCGGSVSVMSPDKTLHLMKKILEEAVAKDADCIATPCPLCQTNVEMYQADINTKFGTNFNIPVVFYSQLMAVAFGMDANKDAALNQNIIKAEKLAGMAK